MNLIQKELVSVETHCVNSYSGPVYRKRKLKKMTVCKKTVYNYYSLKLITNYTITVESNNSHPISAIALLLLCQHIFTITIYYILLHQPPVCHTTSGKHFCTVID